MRQQAAAMEAWFAVPERKEVVLGQDILRRDLGKNDSHKGSSGDSALMILKADLRAMVFLEP